MFHYPMMGYENWGSGGNAANGYPYPMYAQNAGLIWFHMILAVITWVVVIALLIALARWLWYKGDREKKGGK